MKIDKTTIKFIGWVSIISNLIVFALPYIVSIQNDVYITLKDNVNMIWDAFGYQVVFYSVNILTVGIIILWSLNKYPKHKKLSTILSVMFLVLNIIIFTKNITSFAYIIFWGSLLVYIYKDKRETEMANTVI